MEEISAQIPPASLAPLPSQSTLTQSENLPIKSRSKFFIISFIVILITFLLVGGFFAIQWLNSPQKQLEQAIKEYREINVGTVANGLYLDTLESTRDGLIRRAAKATEALKSGNQTTAIEELQALKKRIEFQSRSDKRVEEVAKTGVIWDGNGDGISDYLEPFYTKIIKIINILKK